jgi:hypothetical protein
MVLTVSFVLFPVIGLSCHRHCADRCCAIWHQRRDARTTRLRRPLAKRIRLMRCPRPPHPGPTFSDDRETPLSGEHRTREEVPVICPTSQGKCLRHFNTTGKSGEAAHHIVTDFVNSHVMPSH